MTCREMKVENTRASSKQGKEEHQQYAPDRKVKHTRHVAILYGKTSIAPNKMREKTPRAFSDAPPPQDPNAYVHTYLADPLSFVYAHAPC